MEPIVEFVEIDVRSRLELFLYAAEVFQTWFTSMIKFNRCNYKGKSVAQVHATPFNFIV